MQSEEGSIYSLASEPKTLAPTSDAIVSPANSRSPETLKTIPIRPNRFTCPWISQAQLSERQLCASAVTGLAGNQHVAYVVCSAFRMWNHMVIRQPHRLKSGMLLSIPITPTKGRWICLSDLGARLPSDDWDSAESAVKTVSRQ